ncbi:MAG: ATP-binding protein [Candidatus Omnitrophota bacterium]
MTGYKQREIAVRVLEALGNMPVVVLSGMRQTGKSTFLQNQPELLDSKYLSFDDFAVLEAARGSPESLIEHDRLVIIDEVQKYPEILNVVKQVVDRNRRPGMFILSGSANLLLLKTIAESLAGRAVYLTLHPFTRREILGTIRELPALSYFTKKGLFPKRELSPIKWQEIMKGGMPTVCLGEVKKPNIWFKGYEQTYLERDIRTLSQVADLVSFRHILQLLALRNGQILKQSELARDAKLNVMTATRYISLIEISFVLQKILPYLRNPSSRLIKSPKTYISDTGLASYLTGVRNLEANALLRGSLWESYIVQNLLGILSAYDHDAAVSYWSVQGRYEVDFVIELAGEVIAIEVKSASRWHRRDLTGLKYFLSTSKECHAAIIAYNGTEIFKIEDKIWAVPISVLLS